MERLRRAMRAQLETRDAALARGAQRVGWKLGVGERERIDGSIAVGFITSETLLEPRAEYAGAAADLRADAELAVRVGGGYAAALELVDLKVLDGEPDSVVASNVFHRAVALGPWSNDLPTGLRGALVVDGEVRASAAVETAIDERLDAAAAILATVGEELRPGDVVITGSIVQVPIAAGAEVVADLGPLGRVGLSVTASTR